MKVENIFVYGTLKPDEERWVVLKDKVDFAMPGTIQQALLYDAGPFPFMRKSHDSSDEVQGYICRISVGWQEEILDILDDIEGYPVLFGRDYFSVKLTDSGERVNAIAYFGVSQALIEQGELIDEGVWFGSARVG